MFSLGLELRGVLEERVPRRAAPLSVGVATGVDRSIACRVLHLAMDDSISTRMLCHEARNEVLISALLAREIDLAVTDAALPSHSTGVRSHLVGQSTVTLFGPAALAERYRPRFPANLEGARLVMPARTSAVAKALAEWFRRERISVSVVAEIDGPDLASAMCETYGALLVLPTMTASDVERRYGLSAVGEVCRVVQHFHVVSADPARRQENILAIVERAREEFRATAVAGGAVQQVPDWRPVRCARTRSA
jgi:LysR family transcriptional activator of nhaA